MSRAYSLLPSRFEDGRHNSFKQGLKRIGYEIIEGAPPLNVDIGPKDLILGWNAYGPTYDTMRRAQPLQCLVFEEAYIREINGEKYFACGLGGHNGHGWVRFGGNERWDSWNIDIKPWRTDGKHVLVCGQRGFGYNKMAMPTNWVDDVYAQIRPLTDRPLWFRPHPKRRAKMPRAAWDKVLDFNIPLEQHLEDAWCVVVWTSNSATAALLNGIPAYYCGPNIVTQGAAEPISFVQEHGFEKLVLPDHRYDAMVRLSWSQWSVSEYETGAAFRWLLK